MSGPFAKLALLIIALNLVSGCAATIPSVGSIPADPISALRSQNSFPSVATSLHQSTTQTDIPSGFMGFCVRSPDQCQISSNAISVVKLTPDVWQLIQQTNYSLNNSIWPMDDQQHYRRADYWTIPTDGYGDCEDYALAKRKMLMEAGLPMPALLIAVVLAPNGAHHAVLTVATDRGDYVLDNLRPEVLSWDQTDYTWIERQAPFNPMAWISLSTPQAIASANTGHVENTDTVDLRP